MGRKAAVHKERGKFKRPCRLSAQDASPSSWRDEFDSHQGHHFLRRCLLRVRHRAFQARRLGSSPSSGTNFYECISISFCFHLHDDRRVGADCLVPEVCKKLVAIKVSVGC